MDTQNKNVIADLRPEEIVTYEETYTPEVAEGEEATTQTANYKFYKKYPVISGVLDKLSYGFTHAAAVWYNKLAGITVKDKLDEVSGQLNGLSFEIVTQTEYDAMDSHDANTIYYIREEA